MLDIKRIREKTEEVRQGLRDRDADPALVDKVLEFDARRREILTVSEELKGRRNTVSKQIGQLRKAGEDTAEIQASMRKLGDEIAALDAQLAEVESNQNTLLLSLPNLPAPGVVPGGFNFDRYKASELSQRGLFDKTRWR